VSALGCPAIFASNYGQVITIPKFKDTLGNFSFFISGQTPGGQLTVRAEVYPWDPVNSHATGSAVYESAPRTISYKDTSYHRATFKANASVTPGAKYILFLTTDKDPGSCINNYSLYWAGVPVGTYPGGRFYYLNSGGNTAAWTTSAWSTYIYDSAFTAKMPSK
jgi:hypothetical protein